MVVISSEHPCFVCGNTLALAPTIWDKTLAPEWSYKKLICGEVEHHTRIIICPSCGLIQTYKPLTEEALKSFYKEVDGISPYRKMFPVPDNQTVRHISNAMCVMNQFLDKGIYRSFLDVGSGNTETLKFVRHSYPQFEIIKSHDPGIPESNDNIMHLCNRQFDIITCINTLEHIFNPVEFLSKLRSNLSALGKLIIGVPNVLNTCVGLQLNAWFSPAHIYHFETQTLINTLLKAGFKPMFLWSVTEEMGSKIYMAFEKSNIEENIKKFTPRMIESRINYIKNLRNLILNMEDIQNEK